MDTLCPPLAHHAAAQTTPFKFRTTSVPTTGKNFNVEDVNQDLLVELEDATIDEDTLHTSCHYILEETTKILPIMVQSLPSAGENSPLQITSLTFRKEYFYHDGCWDPTKVPNILRSQPRALKNVKFTGSLRVRQGRGSNRPSQQHRTNTRSRRETVQRNIPGTLQKETIEGTFIPAAGSEEECVAKWFNGITDAISVLLPKNAVPAPTIPATAVTPRMLTRSAVTKHRRYWSSERSCKPIKDTLMPWKPDVVLREQSLPVTFGPQSEFSWKDVVSFVELSSTPYSKSTDMGTVRNNVMRKAYAIFASQPGRRYLFVLSIANQELRAHMFNVLFIPVLTIFIGPRACCSAC